VRPPELINDGNGVKFTLAESIKYKKKSGELFEEKCFIDVVSFVTVEALSKQKVGTLIGVTGRLKQNRWEDDGGEKHSKHEISVKEITFLQKKEKEDESTDEPEW
jgi:single-strand DNA-binding protein